MNIIKKIVHCLLNVIFILGFCDLFSVFACFYFEIFYGDVINLFFLGDYNV